MSLYEAGNSSVYMGQELVTVVKHHLLLEAKEDIIYPFQFLGKLCKRVGNFRI